MRLRYYKLALVSIVCAKIGIKLFIKKLLVNFGAKESHIMFVANDKNWKKLPDNNEHPILDGSF